jgi:hypothetical protein
MAVSHQSGTILQHWNDPPPTTFAKSKSATSSTTTLGLPTPPATPSQEGNGVLVCSLSALLALPSTLLGRNRDMIFARIQMLIKSVEECKITGISCVMVLIRFPVRCAGRDFEGCDAW